MLLLLLVLLHLLPACCSCPSVPPSRCYLLCSSSTHLLPCSLSLSLLCSCCCRETLRLDPVVAGVLRKASTDFELGGYRVPQNTSLLVPLSYIGSHDPRWTAPADMPAEAAAQHSWGSWPREEFNPDVLLTEEGQKQGWLMPFGAGNR